MAEWNDILGPKSLLNDRDEKFWMFTYKVHDCPFNWYHTWASCPYRHHGEGARLRDPRLHSSIPCRFFTGLPNSCGRGEGCWFAHGLYERSLHPDNYRTRWCGNDRCTRTPCFFAHTHAQLRVRPQAGESSSGSDYSVPTVVDQSVGEVLHDIATIGEVPINNA